MKFRQKLKSRNLSEEKKATETKQPEQQKKIFVIKTMLTVGGQ